jgi:glutaredoxin 3
VNDVVIYTTTYCGYCYRAKALLDKRSIPYREVDVTNDRLMRRELIERTRRYTVPQIFIAGQSIGGSDELHALDRRGLLEAALAAVPEPASAHAQGQAKQTT